MKYPKRSQYKHAKQKKYHVRNWAEYNEGLCRRGDLTVWFDEEVSSEESAVALLFGLIASGQIQLRRIDGYQRLSEVLEHAEVAA